MTRSVSDMDLLAFRMAVRITCTFHKGSDRENVKGGQGIGMAITLISCILRLVTNKGWRQGVLCPRGKSLNVNIGHICYRVRQTNFHLRHQTNYEAQQTNYRHVCYRRTVQVIGWMASDNVLCGTNSCFYYDCRRNWSKIEEEQTINANDEKTNH